MRPTLTFPLLAVVGSLLLAQPEVQPRQVFKGHTGGIFNAVYSPDGKLLASAGKDRTIRLWNLTDGKELHRLEGHSDDIYRVLFSPDGKVLASAGDDKTVRLWDPRNGKPLETLKANASQYNLAFHPDGSLLAASGGDGHVRIWQLPAGKLLHAFKAHADRCLGLAFSPDGRLLATAASAGGDTDKGEATLWDTTTWKAAGQLAGASGVVMLTFDPSGSLLATGGIDKSVRLWETCTGREVCKFDGHTQSTYFVAFSPDGRRLASCGGLWNSDKASEVIVWDIATGGRLATFGSHPSPIWSLAYHPDGYEVLSACGKWSGNTVPGEVRLWNVRDLRDEALPVATPQSLLAWWADLHGEDAARAYRAGWGLCGAGEATLTLMREKIQLPKSATPQQITRWVADLAHDDFDVREAASQALEKLGTQARPMVQQALKSPDAELRRRAAEILERLSEVALSREEIHALRELNVLARLGPPARPLVERYTAVAEGTPVGTEARRILRQGMK